MQLAAAKKREEEAPRIDEVVTNWQKEKRAIIGEDAWSRRVELLSRRRAEQHRLMEKSSSAHDLLAFRQETRRQASSLLGDGRAHG
jgi:hypothetical protein